MAKKLNHGAPDFASALDQLLARQGQAAIDVRDVVAEILADVRVRGDAAVVELTRKFDRVDLAKAGLRITAEEVADAKGSCSPEVLAALDVAAQRIEAYHKEQLPEDKRYTDEAGVTLGWHWRPVDAVGLYVPGGLASYPSSVLMNAIPAKVAGVERLSMVVPTPDGEVNPAVLAAAARAGVDEIYRIGGAQAVGALAFGTDSIMPVDKIVGPGNAYVAEAKRQVFGTVGIDTIAGPSEILVVADGNNDPRWVAADLLSQVEHDPVAQAILITDDAHFADAVASAAEAFIAESPRGEVTRAAWSDHSGIILVRDLEQDGPDLINRIAPEHLELCLDDPEVLLPYIRHAGAIFLGRHTPEAIGDYVAGPDHVLPTSGAARFSSGLSVMDFLKRTSIASCTPASLAAIGPAAATLADAEGLWAHALSVRVRLESNKG